MSSADDKNQRQLLSKLKALADVGVGGEKENAKTILNTLLKKHGLTIDDIEAEETRERFFSVRGRDTDLLVQIIKRVNYSLNCWAVTAKYAKERGVKGSVVTICTAAEYVEIEHMFAVYSRLYKTEVEVFYRAFLLANDLLVTPPDSEARTIDELTPEEIDDYLRARAMAGSVKTETIRKQLPSTTKRATR